MAALIHTRRRRPPDPGDEETRRGGDLERGSETVRLGRLNVSEAKPNALETQQANWVSQRFRLTSMQALLVSALAFGEGAR